MSNGSFERVRELSRQHLEDFAIRTAMELRMSRSQSDTADYFVAVLTGFMLGALVAASGFLVGVGVS